MRLSDSERDALVEQLKAHAATGRLSVEELEQRVEVVLEAATREEAVPAVSDLPPLATSATRRVGRGHAESDAPDPGWSPTNERFRDPRTNRIMRVWVDPAGGRHYVAET